MQNSRPAASTLVSASSAVSVVWPVPYGLSNRCLHRASLAATAETEPPCRLERAEAGDAGRRLLAHAGEPRIRVGAVLLRAPGQLETVVDHELRRRLRDRDQVGCELVRRHAVARVYLDPARDERGAHRVLGRQCVRARSDDLRARLGEREHETRRLRLEVDDDRDAAAAQRTVAELRAPEPLEHRHVLPRPRDAPLSLRREADVGDPRPPATSVTVDQVARAGLEPATPRFSAVCSTN